MKKTITAVVGALALLSEPAYAWWAPSEYRCQFDQINDPQQSDGRRRWAQRWMQGNPYGITTWGGRDMRYWQSSFTSEWNDAYAQNYILYPVYADPWNMYAPWKGPGSIGTTTAALTGPEIQMLPHTVKPAHIEMDGLCEPGCYTPDQQILLSDGPRGIRESLETGRLDLVTLTPEATFAKLDLMENKVQTYTLDRKEGEQEILTFHTASGGELRVTTEHPLVMPDGTLKRAREVSAGESLVTKEGKFDLIVEVDKDLVVTKAYNVAPGDDGPASNILVGAGLPERLAALPETSTCTEMNRLIIRSNVAGRNRAGRQ
ncbi:hypothetical protein ACLESD_46285, partial [Pyxidicoccus sp. 3LFB2]